MKNEKNWDDLTKNQKIRILKKTIRLSGFGLVELIQEALQDLKYNAGIEDIEKWLYENKWLV